MKDFVNQMKDSQFYLQNSSKKLENKGIQIGKLHQTIQNSEQKPLTGIDYKRYPKELAPNSNKKSTKRKAMPNLKSAKKSVKTEEIFKKLEEAEKSDRQTEP